MRYLLMLLVIACLQVGWQEPPRWVSPTLSIALTWTGVACVVGLAAILSTRARQRLVQDPGQRESTLQRFATGRFYHLIALFAVFGVSLYLLGWGWLIQDAFAWGPPSADDDPQAMIPGSELFVLAPFLVGLIFSWACFYDVERELHDSHATGKTPFIARWAYIGFLARQNLGLLCGPLLLLILFKDLPQLIPPSLNESRAASASVALVFGASVFLGMPWIFRLVLGLKPMPEGPMRTRLLESARRLNFRCSNLLLWNTRGGVANAMMIGMLPLVRYVVFTDRLLAEMTHDEVEAVFGHEVGHVKHRHIPYYLGFFIISLAIVAEVWEMGNVRAHLSLTLRKDLVVLPLVSLVGAYVFVVFGFLSRRCERQADIYGCRAVSCGQPNCLGHDSSVELAPKALGLCRTGIHTFISALEKVAHLNGISRDRPGWLQSWQHSTIARRVEFLQRLQADPSLELRFQRRVNAVKWLSLIVLAGILVTLGETLGWANLLAF
jgi:Zn-dependent protease with chaperone function